MAKLTWAQFRSRLKGSNLNFSRLWELYKQNIITDKDLTNFNKLRTLTDDGLTSPKIRTRSPRKVASPRSPKIRTRSPRFRNTTHQSQEKVVTIYFVRHGRSCANLQQEKNILPKHWLYRDPELSRLGELRSIENGSRLRETFQRDHIDIDAILCSSMLRAMQTAYYMFGMDNTKPINVVPYVAEKGITLDNLPESIEKQKIFTKRKGIPVTKFKFLETKGRYRSNLRSFLEWLEKNINLITKTKTNHINLVLVTHSSFMKDSLDLKEKPNNNAVVKKTFILKGSAEEYIYPILTNYANFCPHNCRKTVAKCPHILK